MPEPVAIFDFPLLDDLLLLPSPEVRKALSSAGPLRVVGIGPLVEYALHRRSGMASYPPVHEIVPSSVGERVNRTASGNGRFDLTNTSLEALPFEFAPLPDGTEVSGLMWRAFKNRLANAAVNAGFDKLTAKGLAGAFGELQDNARDHSDRPRTVITGYRWSTAEFEMIVGDAGIGVLASLRSHPDYQHVTEHGEALKTALSSGETRYGRGSGHGAGFDTVFRNIAGLQGSLRFRSGDNSLELDGVSARSIDSNLRQRQFFQGFAVSITCRPA